MGNKSQCRTIGVVNTNAEYKKTEMVRVEVKQEEIESDRHQYLVHIIFEVLVKNKWKDT